MVVFDINWNSVEDLYLGMGSLPSRLLFQVAESTQARRLGWESGVARVAEGQRETVFRVRRRMPAGWFITGGFLSMPLLARYARKLSAIHLGERNIAVGVFTSPHYLPLKRALAPAFTIYHAVDDYAHYWPKRAEITRRRERRLVGESDAIVCAGAFLAAHLKEENPHRAADIHHVPNPVPSEFLAGKPTTSPYFAGCRPTPVFGYVGTIDARMDHAAMLDLARAVPEAEIRVYAALDGPPGPLSHARNIVVCPPVPRSKLPELILDFDVCVLPQRRTHFNLCASPRKLYEYLGSSRPIVTLNTPEAETLGPEVISTSSSADFVQAAADLLRRGETEREPARRLDVARHMTPSALAARYVAIMRRYGAGTNGDAEACLP